MQNMFRIEIEMSNFSFRSKDISEKKSYYIGVQFLVIECTKCAAGRMHAAVIFSRVGTSERAAAAAAAARAFPCAGVRAEALRSTGLCDGCSTRRDANQCAVALFRATDGIARGQ